MCARAFRRGFALLACVAMLGGCSSVAKQQYLRHLSTTVKAAQPNGDRVSMMDLAEDPGVVVVAPLNSARP